MTDWEIVVLDNGSKRFPPSSGLVRVGVPLKVAREHARLRRRFTVSLRRWTRENRN